MLKSISGIPGWRPLTSFRKTVLIMKITWVLLLGACIQVSARSTAQSITYANKDASMEDFFDAIRGQTGYEFLYNSPMLTGIRHMDLKFDQTPLTEALSTVFENRSLTYTILGRTIVVRPRMPGDAPEAPPAIAVKGSVTDSVTGQPLPGVTIQVRGGTVGTTTDARGGFTLSVPPDAVLVVSYLGYGTREIPVAGKSQIVIKLTSASTGLSQLVVVGYGTQKKDEITGSVSQVGSEVFEDKPITNIAQGLQGEIPNLTVSFGDGQPNRGGTFNIRGMTSINGGSPLVLIDGVEGDINLINPEDVASVSVLKDAAAAAIYGARASFGVILVTTKHGQKGELKIQYSNDIGWNAPTFLPHVITDPIAAAELQNEGYKGYAGIDNSTMLPIIAYLEQRKANPTLPEVGVDPSNNTWLFGANMDWYKAFFSRHQQYQKHFISLSGGGDKVTYYLSGGIQDQDGVFKIATDTYKRYNFRSKLSLQAFSWLKIYNNSEFDQDIYDAPNKYVNGDYNIYRYLSLFANPYYTTKTPDGNWTQAGMLTYGSQLDGGREVSKNQIFRNTIGFQADLLSHKLTLNGDFTAMWTQQKDDRKARTLQYESKPGTIVKYSNPDFYQSSFLEDFYKVINLYAQYTNEFGKHHLDALVGVNRELNQQRSLTSYISDNLSDDYASLNLASGVARVSDNNADWGLQGIFSRISYNYDERYLLEFNGRYDGTSRFPRRDRYGFFPSVSAGWMISREQFFKPLSHVINTLKIRSSYGSLGNQQVGTYAYIPIMNFAPITQILDKSHPVGTSAPGLVAQSLTWETARTFDLGADMSFLNGRLSVGLDWYRRNTINMLTKSKQLPAVLGTGEPKTNAANLKTLGWESSFKWRDQFQVGNKPFSYDFQVVISDNRSEITRYDNPNGYLGDYYVGEHIGEIWGYVTDGFFKTDDEYHNSADQSKVSSVAYSVDGHPVAGDVKFRDVNGDGVIYNGNNTVSDHGDMKVIGNSTPRYSYGFNAHGTWNRIDLSVFFQGVGKRDFWPGVESGIFWGFYNRWNQPVYDHIYGNYWTPDHTDAYFPKPRAYIASHAGSALYFPQTRYLQNAAYLRLKNVSIGYSIAAPLLTRLHVSKLRVFLSGQNLLTWTKLSRAFDPETIVNDMDVPVSNGNGFVYPISKTYSGGLSITF